MSEPDHYKTLGVLRDATADEIKAAFRSAASAAHPDREGGSDERMAGVNLAYQVLGDAERRAHYDATGDSGRADQKAVAAQQLLASLFVQAVRDALMPDPIAGLRQHFAAHIPGAVRDIAAAGKALAGLERKQARLKAKVGKTFLISLMREQVRAAEVAVAEAKYHLTVLKAARDMLADYEYEAESRGDVYDEFRDKINAHKIRWEPTVGDMQRANEQFWKGRGL